MAFQSFLKRRFLISILVVAGLVFSTTYSIAMPLMMDSSECEVVDTCSSCCTLNLTPTPAINYETSFIEFLGASTVEEPEPLPLPFYHPPG